MDSDSSLPAPTKVIFFGSSAREVTNSSPRPTKPESSRFFFNAFVETGSSGRELSARTTKRCSILESLGSRLMTTCIGAGFYMECGGHGAALLLQGREGRRPPPYDMNMGGGGERT